MIDGFFFGEDVSITAHGGFIQATLVVIGHREYNLPTGGTYFFHQRFVIPRWANIDTNAYNARLQV